MVLIGREDPRPAMNQIYLQDTQSRRMARRMADRQAGKDFPHAIQKGRPLEIERQVSRKVRIGIQPGRHGVKGIFELSLMNIDLGIRPDEVDQSSRMVQVKMAHDDGLDVLDVVACLGDGGREVLVCGVVHAVEDVVYDGPEDFRPVFAAAGFEEDEAGCRVLDED